ncbi:MAG: phosphoribosylglycinamide formyltransferase [Acidimicrobiia bacterium]|nr:phosphoribosylglycinamide formyltransferase [Acidimicrobiia bacterium]
MRLAILVSGSGTLLESVLAAGIDVGLVLSDRPCRALALAEAAGVPNLLVEREDFGPGFERDIYTSAVVGALLDHDIDLVGMAGFGTILGPELFVAMPGRVINTHPALLPSFPGWHAVRDALEFGVTVTGCTIHVATPEVDSGPILAQEAVTVLNGDDEASLHERIKVVERRLYVDTIREILDRGYVHEPSHHG